MSNDAGTPNDVDNDDLTGDDEGGSLTGVIVAVLSTIFLGVFYFSGMTIPFLIASVVVISIVIWQACDPFADAAQWVGEKLQVPGSVRGATLDAIASSMPELFSGIFFVVVAFNAVNTGGTPEETAAAMEKAGAEGYGSTIATCAGSAVYNMVLIPAFCALTIAAYRKSRPTIDVENEVIARDGMWFVLCEMLLIVFLFQDKMYWWMAIVFLGLYVFYILQLARDARLYRRKLQMIHTHLDTGGTNVTSEQLVAAAQAEGHRLSPMMAGEMLEKYRANQPLEDEEEEETTDSAGTFFGYWDIPLSKLSAWVVIIVSTLVAAGACYWLVEVTNRAAIELGVPTFFVAVILAAAASSVPDTFLAIGAAMRGDDSGAVSNAFGSNIFDICICLSIPLLVNSALNGWGPVSLTQDGEPMRGLVNLRIMLVVFTIATLAIMWHNRQLTRNKALVLCAMYLVFVGYAVVGSLDARKDQKNKENEKPVPATSLHVPVSGHVVSVWS